MSVEKNVVWKINKYILFNTKELFKGVSIQGPEHVKEK